MYSFTEENYLKAIYKLWAESQADVSTNAIAEVIHTKAASVTDMLKKLADKKLLHYARYKGVTLTEKGRKVAIQTIRKHRLWEVFLHEKLNFGWDEVHEVAEELEHIQSALLIDKLDEFLGYPTHDPHGDPIPTRDGIFRKEKLQVLGELGKQQEGIMAGIKDHSNAFLRLLDKLGINLGTRISIIEVNDYDGSMEVELQGKRQVHISRDVAKQILVTQ